MVQMTPRSFFVTSGSGISTVSRLNAFDLALNDAGIAHCNLVKVSSIIPLGCEETELRQIIPGSITYAVISKAEGCGETISAGLAWNVEMDLGYGIVAEDSGKSKGDVIRQRLIEKINKMARTRGFGSFQPKFRIETLNTPKKGYGCVVVALVYLL